LAGHLGNALVDQPLDETVGGGLGDDDPPPAASLVLGGVQHHGLAHAADAGVERGPAGRPRAGVERVLPRQDYLVAADQQWRAGSEGRSKRIVRRHQGSFSVL